MVEIVTPSTGAVRNVALDLNGLRVQVGERVLFRADVIGWAIKEVEAISDHGVSFTRPSARTMHAAWSTIAGVIPPGTDEPALLENLRDLERRADRMIEDARKAKADSLDVLLDATTSRRNAFIPGLK